MMLDIDVIDRPQAAMTALEPMRAQLLSELGQPASAAELAIRLGLKRQGINYHLRALEEHGLVEVAGTRRWGGLTERLMVASAATYAISPQALGPLGADPARTHDRLATGYLIALGARLVREVGDLWRRARQADKHLATLSLDAEIRFATPEARACFTRELTQAVNELVSRHHAPHASGGRLHRLVVVSHPLAETETAVTGKDV